MKYLILFVADGIFGYLLQGMGYMMGINSFAKRKIKALEFFLVSSIFGLIAFGIRQISLFNFGFHTILILLIYILVYLIFFKTPMFQTIIGALVTTLVTSVAELCNTLVWTGLIGMEKFKSVMSSTISTGTIDGRITKAAMGIPTNIILIITMLIIYLLMIKKLNRENAEKQNETIEADSQ